MGQYHLTNWLNVALSIIRIFFLKRASEGLKNCTITYSDDESQVLKTE